MSFKNSKEKSLLDLNTQELKLLIPGACHFSFWLIPSRNDHNFLKEIIKDLANKYGTPIFEPHISVYTGIYTQEDKIEEIVTRSIASVRPISLTVQEVLFSDNFFKTLFVVFKDATILDTLFQKIKNNLCYRKHYELQPHLSLLYKVMSQEEKQSIIDQLNFTKSCIKFDEVAVVSPSNISLTWRDIDNWKLFIRRKLVS